MGFGGAVGLLLLPPLLDSPFVGFPRGIMLRLPLALLMGVAPLLCPLAAGLPLCPFVVPLGLGLAPRSGFRMIMLLAAAAA